jgi:hypothetical protein
MDVLDLFSGETSDAYFTAQTMTVPSHDVQEATIVTG